MERLAQAGEARIGFPMLLAAIMSEPVMQSNPDMVSRLVEKAIAEIRVLSALRILEIGTGRRARVAAPDAAALSMIIDHTLYTRQLSIQQVLDVRRMLELRSAIRATLLCSDAEARTLQDTVPQRFASLEAQNRPISAAMNPSRPPSPSKTRQNQSNDGRAFRFGHDGAAECGIT